MRKRASAPNEPSKYEDVFRLLLNSDLVTSCHRRFERHLQRRNLFLPVAHFVRDSNKLRMHTDSITRDELDNNELVCLPNFMHQRKKKSAQQPNDLVPFGLFILHFFFIVIFAVCHQIPRLQRIIVYKCTSHRCLIVRFIRCFVIVTVYTWKMVELKFINNIFDIPVNNSLRRRRRRTLGCVVRTATSSLRQCDIINWR